jgi:hypothetical protein
MRRSLFSALLVLAACFPSAASAAPERYIVVLKDSVPDSAEVASDHSRRHEASVGFVYRHALKGYSATIPSERVAALRADSRVDYVVPDGVASAVAQTLPWGIDRIDADTSSTLAGNASRRGHERERLRDRLGHRCASRSQPRRPRELRQRQEHGLQRPRDARGRDDRRARRRE